MSANFQNTCIDYLTELRAIRDNALATDELSLRPALDSFLKRASEIFNQPVIFLSEGKRLDVGGPDFTVIHKDLPIGYIEAEAYAADLDNLSGHAKEQNERFRTNLDNFLLTNYLEFRLYLGGDMVDSARLPTPPDSHSIKVGEADAEALAILLERFLSGQLPSIGRPRELAVHLARRTRQMRNEATDALAKQMKDKSGDLYGQYQAFREVLLPDLTEDRFADMYAQTVAYGLFAARCTVPSALNFSRQSAADLVPRTNPFLRKLFQQIAAHDLDERVAWIADDIAQLLARVSMETILADFGANTKQQDRSCISTRRSSLPTTLNCVKCAVSTTHLNLLSPTSCAPLTICSKHALTSRWVWRMKTHSSSIQQQEQGVSYLPLSTASGKWST